MSGSMPASVDGGGRGRADDGDAPGMGLQVEVAGARGEGVDRVGGGEEEPVVRAQGGEGGVERAEGGGRGDLDGRDEDRLAPMGLELRSSAEACPRGG